MQRLTYEEQVAVAIATGFITGLFVAPFFTLYLIGG